MNSRQSNKDTPNIEANDTERGSDSGKLCNAPTKNNLTDGSPLGRRNFAPKSYSARYVYDTPSRPTIASARFYSARNLCTNPIQIVTPIRIKHEPTIKREEVEATNGGLASFEKLSKWLEDDPTRASDVVNIQTTLKPLHLPSRQEINRKEIRATNEMHASVKKILEWFENDPFELHKLRPLRTGHNVITKSRVFDHDQELPKSRQVDVEKGSVSSRVDWLEHVFQKE